MPQRMRAVAAPFARHFVSSMQIERLYMASRVQDKHDRATGASQRREIGRGIWRRRPSARPISMSSFSSAFLSLLTHKKTQFDLISSSVSTLPFENREQVRSWGFFQVETKKRKREHIFFSS